MTAFERKEIENELVELEVQRFSFSRACDRGDMNSMKQEQYHELVARMSQLERKLTAAGYPNPNS